MTPLAQALEAYLTVRRRLGSELRSTGFDLRSFVGFMNGEGKDVVTTELALRWATAPAGTTAARWAQRLNNVRRFAAWLSATDPRTEVPSRELLPHRYRRRPPHIYSDEELRRMIREAMRLRSRLGLRAHTYSTLIGLLAATGLRISEALALDRDDVDLRDGILVVRRGKFGKSRFVPLHDSASKALRRYEQQRDRVLPRPVSPAFLLSDRGIRISYRRAQFTFEIVSWAAGLRPPACRPRLHDMRHRFAAMTLVRWYREGRDVERELPKLATYLGHVHVADTYWYIEAVPELLRLATERATGVRRERP